MKQYIDLGKDILKNGNTRTDRTNTGTISVFGRQIRIDLSRGDFPLLTTKKMFLKGIIHELLWFLQGDTNNNSLEKEGVTIWREWAVQNRRELTLEERFNIAEKNLPDYNRRGYQYGVTSDEDIKNYVDDLGIPVYESLEGDGALGPIYGHQWRMWSDVKLIDSTKEDEYINIGYEVFNRVPNADQEQFPGVYQLSIVTKKYDQISELIENLKKKPFSRRHVVSAWNVEDLPDETISPQENVKNGKMALAPCHCLFQFYVREMSHQDRLNIAKKHTDAETLYIPNTATILSQKHMTPEESKNMIDEIEREHGEWMNERNIPKYYLDCQLYQR